MSDIFYRYAPFIQDYIDKNKWDNLRGVQVQAAETIFDAESNVLIMSSTASGKTEAAFFPVLTILSESNLSSFGALYIAPLKSLINDQYLRMGDLLDYSGIPVFHWHGDVASSQKTKALRNPGGILQITPESLESLLMNRSNDVVRLFSELKFVILDEVHTLTGSDRGNQIICLLSRLSRLIGFNPRRIGLSATIGDTGLAAKWLGAGSDRNTRVVTVSDGRLSWKLGMEHFYIQNEDAISEDDENTDETDKSGESHASNESSENSASNGNGEDKNADRSVCTEDIGIADRDADSGLDPGYEYVYDCTKNKKCLIFSNSREETEYVTATMRQIADRRGDEDVFMIHHGNLSASIREEAELKLKDDDSKTVTCATVTLELGIDIGQLERIIQIGSPNSVSSMLQRLGRSGRRGNPPEMMMVFREENPLPNTPLPQLMPWELLKAIAIVQLYAEERFIEPPVLKFLPFSLLFQQTLSVLSSSGELTPRQLAQRVLNLPPFKNVSADDYKILLRSMLSDDYIEMTGEKGLIVGLKGEKLTNSFKFYAVFKDSEDYTVRNGSDEIGTITSPPPVGDRFALAGRVWEVEELDLQRKLIYVKSVKGKMEIAWPGDYGEVNTRILEKMKEVLMSDEMYPYLKPNAKKRLETARNVARHTGMLKNSLVSLGGCTWCLFPWLGTKSFRTLRKYIASNAARHKISGIEFEYCYYMTFKMESGDGRGLIEDLCRRMQNEGIDKSALVGSSEAPAFEKYDRLIPAELLRKAYIEDRLRTDEIYKRLPEILGEYGEFE